MNKKLRLQFLLVALGIVALGSLLFWSGRVFEGDTRGIRIRKAGWMLIIPAALPFLVWLAYLIADIVSWLDQHFSHVVIQSKQKTPNPPQ